MRARSPRMACAAGLASAVLLAGGAGAQAQEAAHSGLSSPASAAGVAAPGTDALARLRAPGDEVRLSDERTVTRWTHAVARSPVRATPSGGARRIARLRYAGASQSAEIYAVLRARLDRLGRRWLQVRVPGRPKPRLGWALARSFGPLRVSRLLLVINRATLRATLYRDGRRIFRAPVGVGKTSTPTPGGRFFVDRKEGSIFGPAYGTHILFTNAYASIRDWPGPRTVGIHGTNQPALVPGRPSHGCIRLRNADIARLSRLTPAGTPLLIR